MQSKNKFIIACAGSGKTTSLVRESMNHNDEKILLTTYTNENLLEIEKKFNDLNGCVPGNVTILTWLRFLLIHCARPYQNYGSDRGTIRSIFFFGNSDRTENLKKKLRYIPEESAEHYFTAKNYIYQDKLAKFALKCDDLSDGLVIDRLSRIFDQIFIDELQDLASYDLDILDRLLNSKINISGVCDPRQATFATHNALKNRGYRRSKVFNWLSERHSSDRLSILNSTDSYRCCQAICDFADGLFPDLPKSVSKNFESKDHLGVFCILETEIKDYLERYNPKILRHSSRFDTGSIGALNFGASKGKTFNRVLIYPTNKMIKYLQSRNLESIKDKSKFYVAVTRARYSVAFVVDAETKRLFEGPKQGELFNP